MGRNGFFPLYCCGFGFGQAVELSNEVGFFPNLTHILNVNSFFKHVGNNTPCSYK